MGEEMQLDESIKELKRISAIPQLKKTTSDKQHNAAEGGNILPL